MRKKLIIFVVTFVKSGSKDIHRKDFERESQAQEFFTKCDPIKKLERIEDLGERGSETTIVSKTNEWMDFCLENNLHYWK